jgi:L-ascorbate metabolism protein UlaG (beta-lactamase superfamily)
MKITKLGNCCFLVEMPSPTNRTVLFDPGRVSSVNVERLEFLDDIVITHEHGDHYDPELLKKLTAKFPEVRIKTPASMVSKLDAEGVKSTTDAVDGIEIFDAPHAEVKPVFAYVDNIGIHYIDTLTHPGDSFHIIETKPVLALPIGAPWGDAVTAVNLALQLKPQHILPMHDFHWSDDARNQIYDLLEGVFKEQNIVFHKLQNGQPVVLEL